MDSNPTLHPEAVGRLYVAHHQWLLGWLRRRLGNAADAADLTHDTFVRMLALRGQRTVRAPRALLGTIAHGLLVNHWRRQDVERAYREVLASAPQPTAPSPEVRAIVIETLVEIDALLDRLPERVRAAFLWAQLEGWTDVQIAQRLGVSDRMVRKYLAQAMLHCLQVRAGVQ